MKLVHTSDTQIKNWAYGGMNPETGLNRRFEDALACFDFIVDHAIKIKADYFVHGGDVNEERNPDSIATTLFSKRIRKLINAGIKVIVTAGNHDIDSSIGTSTSISYLKALEIPGIYIADTQVEVFEFDNIRFLCLPYFTKAQLGLESNEDIVKMLKKRIDQFLDPKEAKEKYNVCIPHYSVDKVFEGLEINEPIVPISAFKGFDYTAMGHIHKYIMYYDDGVTGGYCGSPYKVTFGENHDKYFNVVDFDKGEIDKIKIPNRDFEDIEIDAREADQAGIEEFVLHKLNRMELEGKFLKITILCYQNFNPRTIYEYLKGKKIFHYLPIKFQREKVKEESRLEYKQGMSSVQIITEYLSKQEMPKPMKKQITDESISILETVEA